MKSFDLVAKIYDLINRLRYQRDVLDILRWLTITRGKKFLDIGGGTGAIAHLLFQKTGCRMTVVDSSAGMIAEGKEKGYQAEWLQADPVKTLPIASNSVEGAIMVYTLHHIKKNQQIIALTEIGRVLKKGGMLLIIEMDYHNFLNISLNLVEKLVTLGNVWFISANKLKGSLNKAGLSVDHYEKRQQGYILRTVK
ncbi:methyltransferase domain-containing protein [Candidatus Woesearchaeota archaeon]|nr:methyltransferase domain-containing protein [Candidatus Woesearchaeota archaeon]